MSSLLYTKFDYNGEKVWLVEYLDRMLGTPHPPRVTKREEECAVRNAIEQPVISIYRNACDRLACDGADYIRSEIEPLVDIVCRYTWLSEQNIWKLAYEVLLFKAISGGGGRGMKVELSKRDISTIWLALEMDIRNKRWLSEIKDENTTIAAIRLYSLELADEASLCVRMENLLKEKKSDNEEEEV